MSRKNKKDISRRDFVKGIAAVVAAPMILTACGEAQGKAEGAIVYRFKTRGSRACNACKQHRRYKMFISASVANRNRAHAGCNCQIVTQRISKEDFNRYFVLAASVNKGVVDLRSI